MSHATKIHLAADSEFKQAACNQFLYPPASELTAAHEDVTCLHCKHQVQMLARLAAQNTQRAGAQHESAQ